MNNLDLFKNTKQKKGENGGNDKDIDIDTSKKWVSFNLPSFNLNLFKTGGSKTDKKNINTSLFLVYLAFITAWGDSLLPVDIINYLNSHRLGQLIIGLFIVLFSLEIFSNDEMNIVETIIYTVGIFIIYIISSKQNATFFILTIILLTINYFIDKSLRLKEENKNEILNIRKDILEYLYKIINILIVIVVFVGVLIYFKKQYKDHRKESGNLVMFILKFFLEGSQEHYHQPNRVFSPSNIKVPNKLFKR